MKRLLLLPLRALTACTSAPLIPGPVAALQSGALGQTPSLSGRVEGWPGGAASLRWVPGGDVVGEVTADGAFGLTLTMPPAGLPHVSVVQALGLSEGSRCSVNAVMVTGPAVGAFELPSVAVGAAAESPAKQGRG